MADKKISALTTAASPLAGTEVLPIVQSGATVKVSVADLTQTQNNVAVATAKMAWSGPGHLDVPNDGGLFSKGVYNNIGSNWYYDNALRYNVTGAAGWYQQNSGFHVWYSAASGTAGSPIASFPETMALFPNGDLKLASGNFVPSAAGKGIDFSAATHAAGMTSELLNDYEEGTWTPTGNNVTFASASGKYTKIGRQVTVTFDVTMPSTANADQCQLQGLPFTVGSGGGASIGYTTNSNVVTFLAGDTGTSLNGYLFGGSALANVTYSGARVVGSCTYFV